MAFEHCCFISYRHVDSEVAETFRDDLYTALSDEMAMHRKESVYIDKERIAIGDLFNPALAQALCKSVCMVMIFTARYFDLEGTYCAREYKAMVQLEKERLSAIGQTNATHGLIIPVIFRAAPDIPSEIRSHRQCVDFTRYSLLDKDMRRHTHYTPLIRQMVEYIHERCKEFEAVPQLFDNCDGFPLEQVDAAWLRTMLPKAPSFPGV